MDSNQIVNCPHNLCESKVNKEQLHAHIEGCSFKPVTCAFCQQKLLKMEIKSHLEKCKGMKVPCPLGCSQKLPSSEINAHMTVCGERNEKCKYCGEEIKAYLMERHMKENSDKHLESLLERVNKLESGETKPKNLLNSFDCKQWKDNRRRKKWAKNAFNMAVSKVREGVDVVADKIEKANKSQLRNMISKVVVVFLIFIVASVLIPWFIKLPVYVVFASSFYKRKVQPVIGKSKWSFFGYLCCCWWVWYHIIV